MAMDVGGLPPCLSCRMTDLIRLTSLVFLADFGLKSQSLAIRSHSVPGARGCWTPLAASSRSVDSEAARCAACNFAIWSNKKFLNNFVFHHCNNASTSINIINLDIVLVIIYLTITFTRRRYPKHLTDLFL
jgi:hypothetical protein